MPPNFLQKQSQLTNHRIYMNVTVPLVLQRSSRSAGEKKGHFKSYDTALLCSLDIETFSLRVGHNDSFYKSDSHRHQDREGRHAILWC